MANIKEGRTTIYNEITTEEKLKGVNPENIQLENDFLEYLESVDRAKGTIKQYRANLHIFWCWNLEFNNNKFFVDLTKREISKFQSQALNVWKWSSRRIRTVKATLSSLSNFISNILDDEFQGYRPIIRKIESPANEAVREKTVFTQDELQNLLDVLIKKNEYMKACVLALAIYSGRRKAELTRFKVSYFDESNLICGGSLYKTPEKLKTKGRGQKGKMLDVYTLAKPFKPYLDYWMAEREKLGITSDWLFPKFQDGVWMDEPIGISTMNSYARTFSLLSGRSFYMHLCRHRFCTALSEQNIPDDVIKDIIGWNDVSMVGVYKDIEAEDTFDKYFGEDGIKQVERKGLEDL